MRQRRTLCNAERMNPRRSCNNCKHKEELTPIFLKLFQKKNTMEGVCSNSFYEATITVIQITDKYRTKKKRKLQAHITDEIDAKILHKILENNTLKGLDIMIKWDFSK